MSDDKPESCPECGAFSPDHTVPYECIGCGQFYPELSFRGERDV